MENETEIAEIVKSSKSKDKLNVRGYILLKDKNRDNSYYWNCEYKKSLNCRGRACTILIDGHHYVRKVSDHNHAAEASRANVIRATNEIKNLAVITNDKPSQIIQNVVASTSAETNQHMPSQNALRQCIKRIRKDEDAPTEPENLAELIIPPNIALTISGRVFLLKDSNVGESRVLLFSTIESIRHLSQSDIWLMDGTFKTCPLIFRQIYSIHARVGINDNYRILPLVFALMSHKSEECYRGLFQDLLDLAEQENIQIMPQFILTDFEQATINAVGSKFPESQHKGCHFHLAQIIYRRVQALGLQSRYATDENLSLQIRQLSALAFLPSSEIPRAFEELRQNVSDELNELFVWFGENYVVGRSRVVRNRTVLNSLLFPPSLWSIAENFEQALPRTQNSVEGWHRRWEIIVGCPHPGIFKLIEELRKEQKKVEQDIESLVRGARVKIKMKDMERENRLLNVISSRENRTTSEFLRGIAHNISF